jgi:GNAT superfamily N-acetyltransferase
MTATDTPALVEPVFLHFDATHPEFGLSRVSVRNYLDAEDRAVVPASSTASLDGVGVEAITPEMAEAIIDFFDKDAFPDNPAWGSCYCMFYFLGGQANPDWGHAPWQQTRQAQLDRLATGRTTGAVALIEGRVVGWCNATARSQFPGRATGERDEETCSVVCFVIAPPYRGQGLATRLLGAAVAHARDRGFEGVEAYPRRDPHDAASAYVGSLEMYLDAGFEVVSGEPLVVGLTL